MGKPARNTNSSFEASGPATSYVNVDGAYMDYDAGGGYAQFGAKKSGGGSLGVKIRTMLAGAVVTALTLAAAGDAAFASTVSATAFNLGAATAFAGVGSRGLSGDGASALHVFYNVPTAGAHKFGVNGSAVATLSATTMVYTNVAVSGVTTLNASGVITASSTGSHALGPINFSNGAISGAVSGSFSANVSSTATSGTTIFAATAGNTNAVFRALDASNQSTGTGAYVEIRLNNSAASGYIRMIGTGNTLGNEFVANSMLIQSDGTGGLHYDADGGGGHTWYCGAIARMTVVGTAGTPVNSNVGNLFIANSSDPSGNPSGGGFLYVNAGALKYRGSSGTATTIAIA